MRCIPNSIYPIHVEVGMERLPAGFIQTAYTLGAFSQESCKHATAAIQHIPFACGRRLSRTQSPPYSIYLRRAFARVTHVRM